MQENKLIKLLIPFIAVVVIFESIMLVSSLEKQNKTEDANTVASTEEATKSATGSEKIEIPVIDLAFATPSAEMKVGKSYKVELDLVGKNNLFVDGIETYIKYDPKLVTISNLVSNSELPKASVSKIDAINGLIKNIILIDDKKGYAITKDQINKVLTFNVTPKEDGLIELEISTGNADKEFVTMIVETTTSKKLPFSGSKLEINAIK